MKTWNDAHLDCGNRKGKLATFVQPSEWDAFIAKIQVPIRLVFHTGCFTKKYTQKSKIE